MSGKVNFFLLFSVLLVLMLPFSSGFIIDQHITIGRQSLDQTVTSTITQDILPYVDYYHACNLGTDISVVSYFQIDSGVDDSFLTKLFNIFTFNIGKTYRATHSQSACLRALGEARTAQEFACGYGICSHLMQDTVSHNEGVPLAIEQTNLWNGLLHSPKEISDKNLALEKYGFQDHVTSRQVLDLLYEMTPYFERVFVEDPAFSEVSIPSLIDFFVANVQPEGEYRLGFRSFFALPSYIYWMLLVLFFGMLSILGLSIRQLRDGVRNIGVVFLLMFSVFGLIFLSLIGFGLWQGNIWAMWEVISQFVFSPAMWLVALFFLVVGGVTLWQWLRGKDKKKNLLNLFVSVFVILLASYLVTLPNALITHNEDALHDKAVKLTSDLLNNGVGEVRKIADPVGFVALKEASEAGSGARTLFMWSLIVLIGLIIYFTFKKRGKNG